MQGDILVHLDTMSGDLDVNEKLREQCSKGKEADVLQQLRNGGAVNSQNIVNGWTALHCAVRREHVGIVQVLLENGADPGIRNHKGELAIDMTSNKDICKILNGLEMRKKECCDIGEQEVPTKEASNASTTPTKHVNANSVNFVPGYLANPLFPYALQTSTTLRKASENNHQVELKDQHVILPGYLANPVFPCAVAARAPVMANGSMPKASETDATMNFVPGYFANPLIPCAVETRRDHENNDEIKQMFVPHVEQFGSLVNTYVNSMKSLEKPVEYRMCDSCKTTPVATVFVGSNISEIIVKIRKANYDDPDFIEVELNRKVLTYDELLNVCSRELKIDRDSITKIRKLPDTVVHRDKDVMRLQPYQELEVVLQ